MFCVAINLFRIERNSHEEEQNCKENIHTLGKGHHGCFILCLSWFCLS
jgi:hypothetical protein